MRMKSEDVVATQTQIQELKSKLIELKKAIAPVPIPDYQLLDQQGNSVNLSECFGNSDELIVIHNMGISCPYCTLWADGLNSFTEYLQSRCAFVLVSPDPPAVQARVISERGWRFRMLSAQESSFVTDMGYHSDEDGYWPGYSVFRRQPTGSIELYAQDMFGPNDDYCSVWPMFAHLPKGENGWEPSN